MLKIQIIVKLINKDCRQTSNCPKISYTKNGNITCGKYIFEIGGKNKDKKMIKKSNIIPHNIVENKILLIRGKKVMLDSDLAKLYEIETRVLNQAVKRNKERFPDDFMFSLKREEIMNLSQFVIGLKIKHSPNVQVFTEQGVAMLSSVLKTKKAVEVNIAIMRTFVNIRKFVSTYEGLAVKIADLEKKYDGKIIDIYKVLDKFNKDESSKIEIGFKCK